MSKKNLPNRDFDGEFDPIKRLSEHEVENDSLVKRMRIQRKINMEDKKEASDLDTSKKRSSSNDYLDSSSTFLAHLSQSLGSAKKTSVKVSNENAKKYAHIKNIKLFNSINEPNPYLKNQSETNFDTQEEDSDIDLSHKSNKYDFSGNSKSLEQQPEITQDIVNLQEDTILDDSESNEDSIEIEGVPEAISEAQRVEDKDDEIVSEAFELYKNFVPDINDFQKIKTRVLGQLTGKLNFPNFSECSSLFEKYTEIYSMFEHTVRDNEGHSALLVGPRASGKSSIINHALDKIEKKYEGLYILVKLNAFIHADDATALREIARQLDENAKKLQKLNTDNEQKEHGSFEQRSIGDTFLNILSTLDKDSNLNDVIDTQADKSVISIIFLIDEFEKFTSNNKQTLLYNLFDLSQSSSIPICVVGITTKITTRELLEKRVRSRFSQRIISINRSGSIEEFWQHAKLNLTLNELFIKELNNPKYGTMWNEYFDTLYAEKSPLTSSYLKKLVFQNYYTLKNFKTFCNNCVFPIASITLAEPFPKDSKFKKYVENQSSNYIQSVIKSLSSLELLLVIAAARWVEKYDLQVVNFNLAFREYEDMIKNFNVASNTSNTSKLGDSSVMTNIKVNQKIWSAKILKNSWEILYKLSIIMDPSTSSAENNLSSSHSKSVIIQENKMVQLDITLEELGHLMEDLNIYKRLTKL